ncbi:MAG TPA: flagellar motor switch protein FliN [Acidimicrobiia bacterium]|nr:flagellar motor switch protein FliN [Acidimicrobiia bacterium]
MALIASIPVAEVAAVTARALEQLLGHDVVLTTGAPELGDPADEILPEGATRTVVLPFSDGIVGEVTLIASERFATAMEAATVDASLTTAALPALEAGASAIALTIHVGVNVADAGEIATETLLTSVVGEFAAVPILENDVRVACLVVRIVDDEPREIPTPIPAAAPTIPAPSFVGPPTLAAAELPHSAPFETEPVAGGSYPVVEDHTPIGVALHEFQPLGDGGSGAGAARPLTLLNDVNMEVTAELGRRRLKVRDIVGLKPGSVVELDRAAGSPVDVLVNGALVWHGEVVVVDEEFGIRVSEIVVDEN